MGITNKELMQTPKFEGLGKFVYARPGNGDWAPTFTFEFFGGQVSVEVGESESLNPPAVGTMYFIQGDLRRNARNGTITLGAKSHKYVAVNEDGLSMEQTDQYVRGLVIRGVGVVEDKQSFQMVRQPAFLSATLKWQGGIHRFKQLPPELYQRIPGKGSYVRFELSIRVREERNNEGQLVVLQVPSLESIQLDKLETGSVAGTSSGVGVGAPAKPAVSAPKA
jgi:hypothetical protein